ncbi:DUF456 domain-containing protein [Natronosalvus halobius]|uniref:DUF456 domain-containing protein n=1 Tax=Natronosalvus halobius TaxID=2953746 RepID=UPI0020A02851|nr:DUF456 domain-containing protein [Natronosalvus halobius]USZ72601.1 DUF456 domain-containing protein [Natronosalvus halobius]
MVDALTVLAVVLLIGGIAGTVVPLVPGGGLSLAGLFLYWWHTGYTEPGVVPFVALTALGLATLFAEFFAGSLAARAGGASWQTTALAAAVGIALMIVTGPLGFLVGLFGTVFALEFVGNRDLENSLRAAGYATAGTLASTAVQFLLTSAILVGFLLAVFVF